MDTRLENLLDCVNCKVNSDVSTEMMAATGRTGKGIRIGARPISNSLLELERLHVSQDVRLVRSLDSDLCQYSSGVRSGHVVTN
jgi:hypothetical protein